MKRIWLCRCYKDDTYYVVKVNVTKNTASNKLDVAVTSVQKYVNGAASGSAGTSLGAVIFENKTEKHLYRAPRHG